MIATAGLAGLQNRWARARMKRTIDWAILDAPKLAQEDAPMSWIRLSATILYVLSICTEHAVCIRSEAGKMLRRSQIFSLLVLERSMSGRCKKKQGNSYSSVRRVYSRYVMLSDDGKRKSTQTTTGLEA
jgi:hypothetical protein